MDKLTVNPNTITRLSVNQYVKGLKNYIVLCNLLEHDPTLHQPTQTRMQCLSNCIQKISNQAQKYIAK